MPHSIGKRFRMFWFWIGQKIIQYSPPIKIQNAINGLPTERGVSHLVIRVANLKVTVVTQQSDHLLQLLFLHNTLEKYQC